LSGQPVFVYHYNADNRLVKVEGGNSNTRAEYYYDPFGRRLWKDVAGTRTYFFYSDEGVIAKYDASGTEIRSYGYQPDSTWTTDPLFLKQENGYYFYQNDHLGTPQKLVAQNGTVVWSATYSAFGQANVEVETITNNLRFPGQYYDAETGLHYNFQRYYDPVTGRYVSVDPIGFDGGDVNFYRYGRSKPIDASDPNGLSVKRFIKKSMIWIGNLSPESYNDWIVNHTPGALTQRKFWYHWTPDQQQDWLEDFREEYGYDIEMAARQNCIPRELLAVLIANEQLDYSYFTEELWEDLFLAGNSLGVSQLYIDPLAERVFGSKDLYQTYLDAYGERALRRDIHKYNWLNIGFAAKAMRSLLDELCDRAYHRKLSPNFIEVTRQDSRENVFTDCKYVDFCCLANENCDITINMDVSPCLLRAMAGIWNSGGLKITESDDIEGEFNPSYRQLDWAHLLDGYFEKPL
ncbi:MAG: hypothetical protein GY801_39190, partial [bacterium]|nr:hypothetical protein [bacterium]